MLPDRELSDRLDETQRLTAIFSSLLSQALTDGEPYLNVDCQDLVRWAQRSGSEKDKSLYTNLVDYPSEVRGALID